MTYAIARTQKLKGSQIRAADSHNRRLHEVNNADENAKHFRIHGEEKPLKDFVDERIDGGAKIRKDGVEMVEVFLSASPEFFRPEDPSAYGVYDPKKMEAWAVKSRNFLREKYGDNLAAVDLHLDEATPHMHAMITPIVQKQKKKRGKDEYYQAEVFDAKTMFNRAELIKLQDEYAAAVKPLGLKRGIKKSSAHHQDIKSFYGQVNGEGPSPQPKQTSKRKPDEDKNEYAKRLIAENMAPWIERAEHYRQRYEQERAKTAGFVDIDPDQAKKAIKDNEHLKDQLRRQEEQLAAFRQRLGPSASVSISQLPKRP